MDKYQEALDYVNKSVCTALSCLGVNDTKTKESLHTLQELVDKEKSPTLEEVKKEWEELGYEWKEDTEHFYLAKDVLSIISFNKREKYYYANHRINRIVHKLITKTFKAWEDSVNENNI